MIMKVGNIINIVFCSMAMGFYTSCHENEFGVVDLTPKEPEGENIDYVGNGLQHPCLLVTDADFEYIKSMYQVEGTIQKKAYDWMTRAGNNYSQTNYTPKPVKRLARLDNTNWGQYNSRWENIGYTYDEYLALGDAPHSNYMNFTRDCAAAFTQAVLWKITDNNSYAETASKILNAWASTNEGYIVNQDGSFIDSNQNLIALSIYQIVNAAELMREYGSFNFEQFKKWILEEIYPYNKTFLAHEGQNCPVHAWLNWDLANMTAMLSIGVLADDNQIINDAINYYKYTGKGSGFVTNAIPFVHQDPDSEEILGQCQESGRDQAHAGLCTGLLAIYCKMASNIGEDILAYADYSALSMFEYHAKYTVGTSEVKVDNKSWYMQGFKYAASQVPYTALVKCTNTNPEQSWPELSYEEKNGTNPKDTRGVLNPSWELVCRLAEDAGQSAIYSKQIRDVMRNNTNRGNCDGGAGDYGPDSGGFDIFGWGSLLYAKE